MKKLNDTRLSNVIGGRLGDRVEWALACLTHIADDNNPTCIRIAKENGYKWPR